jgi:hypothetical protein
MSQNTPTIPENSATGAAGRIPLWAKLLYSGFVAVLVPYYWATYGPTNFLYFCDMALLITLVAIWTESPLLVSMPAVGILLPQALWCIDFLCVLLGMRVFGLTDYMFNPNLSLVARGLSFFHFWLPFLLLWLVWRLGYDRRALMIWTLLAWLLMLICFFLLPAPPPPAGSPNLPVNVNYVHGFSDAHPQEWMPPLVWFALIMVGLPVVIFLPTHYLLDRVFGRARAPVSTAA